MADNTRSIRARSHCIYRIETYKLHQYTSTSTYIQPVHVFVLVHSFLYPHSHISSVRDDVCLYIRSIYIYSKKERKEKYERRFHIRRWHHFTWSDENEWWENNNKHLKYCHSEHGPQLAAYSDKLIEGCSLMIFVVQVFLTRLLRPVHWSILKCFCF